MACLYHHRRDGLWWKTSHGLCRALPLAGGKGPFCVFVAWSCACSRSVVVSPHDRVVHAHLPLDLVRRVRLALDAGKQPIPSTIPPPVHEAIVAGLPGTVAKGQIPPRCSGTQPPKDAVYGFAVVASLAATSAVFGKERNELFPGFVANLSASDHTHSSSSRALYRQKLSRVRVFVRQALAGPEAGSQVTHFRRLLERVSSPEIPSGLLSSYVVNILENKSPHVTEGFCNIRCYLVDDKRR